MSRFDNNGFHGGSVQHAKKSLNTFGISSSSWRDPRPVPPIADYLAYEASLDPRARKHFNPHKHRRITILIRNGETFNEACHLAGFRSVGAVRSTRAKMPEHLR